MTGRRYHVVAVSHHLLRRRARAAAEAYERQGEDRVAREMRAGRGPWRWRVEYLRYEPMVSFSSSKR